MEAEEEEVGEGDSMFNWDAGAQRKQKEN
jgi:hypothetical protein